MKFQGQNRLAGKIDSGGFLHINRGGRELLQECPYIRKCCSHHCPKFGEPDRNSDSTTFLRICDNRLLVFKELIDERLEEKADS